MIIHIDTPSGSATKIDTGSDLSSEERHILQKLLCWRAIADSVEQFREKKEEALTAGWNNSGPVRESHNLRLVVRQLEEELRLRLADEESS